MPGFDTPFSGDDAKLCIRLSHLAYKDSKDPEFISGLAECGLAFNGALSDLNGGGSPLGLVKVDTQAFCADDEKRRFIVFRGSEPNFWDWITDFRVDKDQVAAGGGNLIHEGFHGAIMGAETQAALDRWTSTAGGKAIYLTGHSLGGALALTMTVVRPGSYKACYTYGQPRIGLIARPPSTPICRVVNRADIVPRLPVDFAKLVTDTVQGSFKSILAAIISNPLSNRLFREIDYAHVGTAYVIGLEGQLIKNGEGAYEKMLTANIRAEAMDLLEFIHEGGTLQYAGGLISDHFSDKYNGAVNAIR
jgi:hypothetical protein